MTLLLAGLASAASVAVLDFDGYGVAFSDAQVATQGLRDAFLAEGLLDPLSGSDIADGAAKGQDAALRRARERVAEGRRRYDAGDVAGALPALEEAVTLHGKALSDVGRRAELADAHYLLGLCLLKAGREPEARVHFTEAAFLFPRYAKERATRPPATAAEALRTAEEGLVRSPRRVRTATQVQAIGEALAVDFVVTGTLEADGRMRTRLYAGSRLLGEATAQLQQLPALHVDDAYGTVARDLAGAAGALPVAEVELAPSVPVFDVEGDEGDGNDASSDGATGDSHRRSARGTDDASTGDRQRRPDAGEDPDDADAVAKTTGTASRSSARSTGSSGSSGSTGSGTARARGPATSTRGASPSGAVPTDRNRTAVTDTWWFWTGAFFVVTGGAGAIGYALWEPEAEVVEDPDTWSVRVATE